MPNKTTKLDPVLKIMREGVLVLGENMRITLFNEAADSAFGGIDGGLGNRRLSEVIRDFSLHEAFDKAIRNRESSEVRVELPGDELRIFDVLVSPLDTADGKGAVGVFYEITRVEKLERVRQEFLLNISHELRTPLTSILAFVETLEDGAIDDEAHNRRFLEVIRQNAQRMRELIDDFSELSSIEARDIKVDPQPLKLHTIVNEVMASLSALANEREILLVNSIPEDAVCVADSLRLQQMLTNLIDNGIKFSKRGGSVTVTFESEGLFDHIKVTDSGEGILKEHQHRIFERFYRVDKARTREIGGTGLGLAIVKHLAKLHNGEVSVKSTASVGATFCISLPRPK